MREISPYRSHEHQPVLPQTVTAPSLRLEGVRSAETHFDPEPIPPEPWTRMDVLVRHSLEPELRLPDWMQTPIPGAVLQSHATQSGIRLAVLTAHHGQAFVASLPMGFLPVPLWIEQPIGGSLSAVDPRNGRAFAASGASGLVRIDFGGPTEVCFNTHTLQLTMSTPLERNQSHPVPEYPTSQEKRMRRLEETLLPNGERLLKADVRDDVEVVQDPKGGLVDRWSRSFVEVRQPDGKPAEAAFVQGTTERPVGDWGSVLRYRTEVVEVWETPRALEPRGYAAGRFRPPPWPESTPTPRRVKREQRVAAGLIPFENRHAGQAPVEKRFPLEVERLADGSCILRPKPATWLQELFGRQPVPLPATWLRSFESFPSAELFPALAGYDQPLAVEEFPREPSV